MKVTKTKAFILIPSVLLLFGLIAWSPPGEQMIVVGNTTMTTSSKLLVVGGGSSGTANKALVVGTDHVFSSNNRTGSVVAGDRNHVDAMNTLVSGYNNSVDSVHAMETRNSCLIGGGNLITTAHGFAIGYLNTISGDYGATMGYGLTMGSNTYKAVALGHYNEPMSSNDVVVIGAGSSDSARNTALRATSDGSVILGSTTSGAVLLAKPQGDISMGSYSY